MTRDERQEIILQKYSKTFNGTLVAYPGFGKTTTAIKCFLLSGLKKLTIIVPTIVLRQQWEKSIEHLDCEKEIIIINTASKLHIKTEFLIYDEAHRLPSETFRYALINSKSKARLCLTASPKRADNGHLWLLSQCPIFDTVTLEEGIKHKWTNPFEIVDLRVDLTTEELRTYEISEKIIQAAGSREIAFKSSMYVCSNYKKFQWNEIRDARAIMRAFHNQKSLIYNSENKFNKVLELLEQHQDRKIIVFSEQIKIIDALYKKYKHKSVLFHSKIKEEDAEIAYNKFVNNECNVIFSAKSLNEGINIPDCDMAICISYSSSKIQILQQLGRILRSHPNKQKSIFYNFILNNTQEVLWNYNKRKELQI